MLRLASKVDAIRDSLDNDEEKVSHLLDRERIHVSRIWFDTFVWVLGMLLIRL